MKTLVVAVLILSLCAAAVQAEEQPRVITSVIRSVEYITEGPPAARSLTVLHLTEGTLVLKGFPEPGSHWPCAQDQFKRAIIVILPGNVVGTILPVEDWMVRQ